MSTFTIYPAIDLRNGQVVRLRYGDPNQQTAFSDDPEATAQAWADEGARWLHIVNLDGAFGEGGGANWALLPALTNVGAAVQFGGGIRTLADIERALKSGATRVILGTAAVEAPDLLLQAVRSFGVKQIVVGLDARDGLVRTRGWQTNSGLDVTTLARGLVDCGIRTVVHTDIGRDGVLTGVNGTASAALAEATGLEIIASGGVANLADVAATAALARHGVGGVIIGRALYDGRLRLADALTHESAGPAAAAAHGQEGK